MRGRSDRVNEHTGRWIGIEISKAKLGVALLDQRGKARSHVFNKDAKGHALMIWLGDKGGLQASMRVCMEATGPYSDALAIALADAR